MTLSQAEFAFSSIINRSIGLTPFTVVYTKHPKTVIDLRELPPRVSHRSSEALAEHILQLHWDVRNKLEAATREYKAYADRHR